MSRIFGSIASNHKHSDYRDYIWESHANGMQTFTLYYPPIIHIPTYIPQEYIQQIIHHMFPLLPFVHILRTYKNPQTPNPTPASKAAEPSVLSIPAASLNVAGLALPLVALVVAVVVPVGADLVAPDVDAPADAEPVGVVPAPAAPEDAALTVTPTLPHSFWENSATSIISSS